MKSRFSFPSEVRAFFCVLFFTLPLVARALSFDDVHLHVGSGSHKTAIVIDWSLPSTPSRAWVLRWENPTSLLEALHALDREDPRLHLFFSSSALLAAGYDLRDSNCYFHFQNLDQGNTLLSASDPQALLAATNASHFWLAQSSPPNPSFSPTALSQTLSFASSPLEDNTWVFLQFTPRPPRPALPEPAFSPYAFEVVSASIETNKNSNKFFHLNCVLGPPTRMCPSSSYSPAGPVSPLIPAATTNDLVTLYREKDSNRKYIPGTGSITVRFDHPVLDDPANPWGLDFLVFGNAFTSTQSRQSFKANLNPENYTLDLLGTVREPGLVEVSQDGTHWFSFANGPYADDWAPTLGYTYNPDTHDPSLFPGNLWWSTPTDATRPPDPALTAASIDNLTLAQIAQRYEGSAGGTGFDITSLPLPTDEHGRKWIQFVRITSLTSDSELNWTEIDALSDVAPCGAYERYLQTHIPLTQRVSGTAPAPSALAPNGRTYLENAALGLAPNESSPAALHIQSFSISGNTATFAVPGAPAIQDLLYIRAFQSLTNPSLSTLLLPHFQGLSSDGLNHFSLPIDESAPACFYQLLLQP